MLRAAAALLPAAAPAAAGAAAPAFGASVLFADDAVLQAADAAHGIPSAQVVGWGAGPGDAVELAAAPAAGVAVSRARVAADGGWAIAVTAAATDAAYDLTLTVNGSVVAAAHRVRFGDVFICGGQSNMEYPVSGIDTKAEVLAAAGRPNVHLFSIPDDGGWGGSVFPANAPMPLAHRFPPAYTTQWVLATSATVAPFSAICYLTAVDLLGRFPAARDGARHIGLIQAAKGGTPVESWTPPAALERCNINPDWPTPIQDGDMNATTGAVNVSKEGWAYPSSNFNQAIGPLLGTSVRSFLWYQGEANMNEGFHLSRRNYACIFREMIVEWRAAFSQPAAPFNLVQLHACDGGNTGQCFADFCNYGDIRLAQSDAARTLPRVGFAVSYDNGHVGIHSPHKAEVGRRLALKVVQVAYGEGAAAADGPGLRGACVAAAPRSAGDNTTTVRLALRNAAGLALRPTQECAVQSPQCCNGTAPGVPGTALGLAQVSVGQVWHGQAWYDAALRLDGDDVLLSADLGDLAHRWDWAGPVNLPVWQVRFALGAFPSCAVVNANGIPLAPFGPVAVSPACGFPAHRRQRRG